MQIRNVVRRHRLLSFFVLAYLLSWWAWVPYAFGVFPIPVASFGPFLAALAVLAATEGKAGVVGLFRPDGPLAGLPDLVRRRPAATDGLAVAATALNVFNWVFNNTGGSVLLIMLMHAANNAVSGSFFSPMFTGADSVRQSWLLAAVWTAAALAIVAIFGPQHLSRHRTKVEIPLVDTRT